VLVVEAIEDLKMHQMDVKIALLMEIFQRRYICKGQRALWSRVRRIWYVSFKIPIWFEVISS
jgi:hypothetical protein